MNVGGKEIEGVGFGIGMERALMALPEEVRARFAGNALPLICLVSQNEAARDQNLERLRKLRALGFRTRMELSGKSMKAQMKGAGRHGARFVVLQGEAEVNAGTVQLRDMESGEQRELPTEDLTGALKSALELFELKTSTESEE